MVYSSLLYKKIKNILVVDILTLSFFILFFVIGVCTYDDYGISFDEGFQRTLIGAVNYNFIETGNPSELLNGFERYYGPAYELILYSAEKIFKLSDSRDIYLLRHLIQFLSFFIATVCFYFLGLKLFQKKHLALLGCLFLVLSPRIFAEAFYNSKDLSMLSFSIIACYTMYLFVERQTVFTALLHALLCAFLIDIRITGILLPFITLYFILVQPNKKIIPILSYIVYLFTFIILFWPFLWKNPMYNFIEAFHQMSQFPWKGTVLYLGQYTPANELPWHYLFVWIGISTPILYVVLFFCGVFFFFKNSLVNFKSVLHLHPIAMFAVGPLIIILGLHSVVYDSWRHVFFIYPFILLIAVYGLAALEKYMTNKIQIAIKNGLILFSLASTSFFMISNHPLNNLYFNVLAGKESSKKFEMDYWGLSYRKGLEYILQKDASPTIYVYDGIGLAHLNRKIINKVDRERLVYTDSISIANYFLTNHRWHPEEYTVGGLFHKIDVDSNTVLEIRKLK
jgi:hypothetical protein